MLRIGQIQFCSHRYWPEVVTDAESMAHLADTGVPAELTDYALRLLRPGHEQDREEQPASARPGHYVYARVELTGLRAQGRRNPWAHGRTPVEWARELLLGVVESACFSDGGSAWRLMDGHAIYHGRAVVPEEVPAAAADRWSHSLWFSDPHETARWSQHFSAPLQKGSDLDLRQLPHEFAEALAEADPAAEDALAEARWYRSTRGQADGAQRVMLHVRAFERSLPLRGSERWNDAVHHYFRSHWAIDQFHIRLRSLAPVCHGLADDPDSADRPGERIFLSGEHDRFHHRHDRAAGSDEDPRSPSPRQPAIAPVADPRHGPLGRGPGQRPNSTCSNASRSSTCCSNTC